MKFRTKLVLSFLVISGIIGVVGILAINELRDIEKSTKIIPEKIHYIALSSKLDSYAQSIRYYDEVLTQSARNFAFTQDKTWEDRYRYFEPILDMSINDALLLGDEDLRHLFQKVDDANKKLVDMEYKSIDLVNQGNSQEAIDILQSQEYLDNKAIYENALRKYVEEKGIEYLDVLTTSTNEVETSLENVSTNISVSLNLLYVIIPMTVVISVIFGILMSNSITRPIKNLEKISRHITQGDLDFEITTKGCDEISSLSKSFDLMRNSIKENKKIIQSQIEELKSAEVEKDEFSTMMSHELKTPIFPIKMHCEMLKDQTMLGKLSSVQIDSINQIELMANQLDSLTGDILDAQKLHMNRMKFYLEKFKVSDLLREVIDTWTPVFIKKEIELSSSYDSSRIIITDKQRMFQVFSNLLRNSTDFVKRGAGKIKIGFENKDDSIVFFVKDNGCGIPPENIKHLFKKFYQVDTTLKRKHQGTGLGLVICKGIVEGLGGEIWIESKLGKGTTIYFSIPQNAKNQPAIVKKSAGRED